MAKKIGRICALLCASLIGSACDGESKYAPLGDGYRWEYDVSVQNEFEGSSSYRLVSHIEGQRELGGKRYFRELTQGQSGVSETLLRVADGAVFSRLADEAEYVMVPKLTVGKSWVDRSRGDSTVFRVESKERVSTPLRTFDDCYRVSAMDSHGDEVVSYYCAGVGLAKQEIRMGPTTEVQLLTGFFRPGERQEDGSRSTRSTEGQLTSLNAGEALQRFANGQGGGVITIVGIQELSEQKRAFVRIRMEGVPLRTYFGGTQLTQPGTIARAEFTLYNERGWVLTRVAYGSHSDYTWDADIAVEQN